MPTPCPSGCGRRWRSHSLLHAPFAAQEVRLDASDGRRALDRPRPRSRCDSARPRRGAWLGRPAGRPHRARSGVPARGSRRQWLGLRCLRCGSRPGGFRGVASPRRRDRPRYFPLDHRRERGGHQRQRRRRQAAGGPARAGLRRAQQRPGGLRAGGRGRGSAPAAARARSTPHAARAGDLRGRGPRRARLAHRGPAAGARVDRRAPHVRPCPDRPRALRGPGSRTVRQHPHGGRGGPGNPRAGGSGRRFDRFRQ